MARGQIGNIPAPNIFNTFSDGFRWTFAIFTKIAIRNFANNAIVSSLFYNSA